MIRAEVRVYGELVGRLEREASKTRFRPDVDWLHRNQRPPLGLAFLGTPQPPVVGTRLPAYFENLLPEEGSALRLWLSQKLGVRNDALALLLKVGRDLTGAVEVTQEETGETSLPSPSDATGDSPEIRFSLAGMQLKMSMVRQGERFAFPARSKSGRWIIKFPGESYVGLPEVEAATMDWAAAMSLPVPKFAVFSFDQLEGIENIQFVNPPPKVFGIERFDRRNDGRLHQEDMAQALGLFPEQKYAGNGAVTTDSPA
ncbi:MAG: HipA domain-containing protein [Deltaproteobacteria bacterium]|nr:HipA domain-containing protein [Deltaproteobacteria bacterium]